MSDDIVPGTYFMDLYGRIFVVVRTMTDSLHRTQKALIAPYPGDGKANRIPMERRMLETRVEIEGFPFPFFQSFRIRDLESSAGGLGSPPPVLAVLDAHVQACKAFATAENVPPSQRTVLYRVPDAAAFEHAQTALRNWARARFFPHRRVVQELQQAMLIHGRVDTPLFQNLTRLVKIIRHFETAKPPPSAINAQFPPLV